MKLINIYEIKDSTYANFKVTNESIGIEYDESTNKVLELHFSIIMQINLMLKEKNFTIDEEQCCFFDSTNDILTVPIKEKNT